MKTWEGTRLESFWRLRVNSYIHREEELFPYRSPSGDTKFEERVNTIIRDWLLQLEENPELLRISPYNLNSAETTKEPAAKPSQEADPVNLFNGDFVYTAVDFQINGAGIDFIFARSYSQLLSYRGPLGFNWDHSYNLWLRVEDGEKTIHRSTGVLGEQVFVRHQLHDYWVPPDGAQGIIARNGNSFVFRYPEGVFLVYEPHQNLHPLVHVVARIEDRFGNQLRFFYADGLLVRIEVNHPGRVVEFRYDSEGRIVLIRDFSGRAWRYHYDDMGDLVAVTTPATSQHRRGATTRYEYAGALVSDKNLQHNLTAIIDADGRMLLENEYGADPGLLSYRRVVRQRQGNGEFLFDYADVIQEFEFSYADHERPAHETIVTERDGRQIRCLFNRFGHLIFKEEYARTDGVPRLVSSHFRYNRDGNLVGTISPLGVITQALYGRDLYERRFPPIDGSRPETDPNLTPEARLQFENLLAVVKRGSYHSVQSLAVSGGLWAVSIFPDVLQTDAVDAIQKFTYEPEFAQLLTASDPRFTRSADPGFSEDAEFHRRLTRYLYSPGRGFQNLFLESVELPAPVAPDGTPSAPVVTRFAEYDGSGRIARIVAPNGLETLNAYAGPEDGVREGFLESTTLDPGGLNVRRGMERDDLGRVVRFFRPQFFDVGDDRFASTSEYDELSRIVRTTSTPPFAINTRYRYSRTGVILRSETDMKDASHAFVGTFVTQNGYDHELNLIRQTTGNGDNQAVKTAKVVFDRDSRPALYIAPSGRKSKTAYNERGLIARTITDYGGVHAVTRGFYDADGRLARVIDPRGAVTRFGYDALGRIVDVEDALGNRTVRHFDKTGRLLVECIFERAMDNAFALLFRREFTYDELGRMIVSGINKFEQVPPIPATGLHTTFRESGPGELLTLQYFYDSVGNLVKQIDQDGRVFQSDFDLLGRVRKKTDPNGNEVRFTYDKEGNVVRVDRREVTRDSVTNAVTTERHFAQAFVYDELNRLTEEKTPIGNLMYRYDSRGKAVEIQDPLGHVVENSYDTFGRLVQHRRWLHRHEPGDVPVPVTTSYAYDLDDQRITQTDAIGRTTGSQYDSTGRLVAIVLPDGSADARSYDRLGNVTEYQDRNGLLVSLDWDKLSRPIALRIDASTLGGGAEFEGATTYRGEYDALNRLKRVENDFVANRFTYNSLDQPLRETVSFTAASRVDLAEQLSLAREFTSTGALMGLAYPSGREIRFERDILDRVVRVVQVRKGDSYPGDPALPDDSGLAVIDYEGLQVGGVARHNGISTRFRYDFGGRTVEIRHARGSNPPVLTLQFLYDAIGNMRQRIESSEDHVSTETFRYDSLSRLFEASRSEDVATLLDLTTISPPGAPLPQALPDHQAQIDQLISAPLTGQATMYNYDLVGNRVSKVLSGVQVYETNDLDQYVEVNGVTLRYDNNGNLVEDDAFRYGYDHRNQMTRLLRKSDGQETTFFFDYFGRRCGQREGARSSVFLYDRHDLIEQYNGSTLARSVIPHTKQDEVLVSSSSGSDFYLLSDLTGSVRYLFEGAVKRNFYIYDEFGNLRDSLVSADDNPFRFAGKRLLGESGKYDFTYRTYDPAIGKFMQPDPKGYVDGTNRYIFLRNNPLVLTDSLGLESRTEHAALHARIGAEMAYRHPPGFTLKVPDNFDEPKLKAAKERINNPVDRGVGIRGYPPGGGSRTNDLRTRDAPNVQAFRNALDPAAQATIGRGRRGSGRNAVDHVVELQMIIRQQPGVFAPGADTTRPQDLRLQDYGLNSSQGKSLDLLQMRQVREGVPFDTPAGGVARERDANKFWNRQGYRTGIRYFGLYDMIGGTGAGLSGLGDDIREGNWGSAALSGSGAAGGMLELGGYVGRSATLLRYGRALGAPAAVVSSGLIGVRIGTNLYENYVDREMVMDAGSWVEEKTGSRILGATAAAATAVGDAIVHAPEAAYDYVVENVTLDPDEIDWGRTLRPWRWF